MRVGVFVGAVAVAAAVVLGAASASVKPPTWAELFSGSGVASVASVPGLTRQMIPGNAHHALPIPTPKQCVAVWNSTVPSRTRRWLGARGAHSADITFMRTSAGQIGGSGRTFSYSQCAYGIAVGKNELVVAIAPLHRRSERWSGELLRYTDARTLTTLLDRFNAVLGRDGSIRLR